MPLIILLPILAVAAVGGYYYGKVAKKPVEETVLRQAQDTAKEATGRARGWLGRLRIGRRKKEAGRFREWAAGLPGVTKAFAAWLEGLSPQEAETFAQRVASFGSGLKVNLAWLLDGQMDTDPELKPQVEKAMALYCQAYWKAAVAQDDVEAFAAFQAWQEAPNKHKELSQRLFARLADDGLVSAPSELYLAPEKERQAHAAGAVRDFAEKDRPAFNAILKEELVSLRRGRDTSASTEEPAPGGETAQKKSRRRKPKGEASATPASVTT